MKNYTLKNLTLNFSTNYCSCENCRGGFPVKLPRFGAKTTLISTGRYEKPAHQYGRTLFIREEDISIPPWKIKLGAWVLGKFPPDERYTQAQEESRQKLVSSEGEEEIYLVPRRQEQEEED